MMNMNINEFQFFTFVQNLVLIYNSQIPINTPQYFFNNKVVQQQQEVKQEEGVQIKEEIEYESELQFKKEKQIQKDNENEYQSDYTKIHIFPGQSKNYYKNMGQKIVKFIYEYFQEDPQVMNDSQIKHFIKISSQGFNRNAILKLKRSKIARKILKIFFGNYRWVKPFISQHKAELDLYFRYNTQVYCPQKKQKQQLRNHQIKQEE